MRRAPAAAALVSLLAAWLYVWNAGRARFAPEASEVAALRQKLDELQQQFEQLTGSAPEQPLGSAPGDGLVVGVPTSLARSVARQIVSGYLGNVRLTLRDKTLKTKRDEVQARLLFARRTVGRYELQTRVLDIGASLRPRQLQVSFEAGHLAFRLPVAVSAGSGRARLTFAWDSKGIADLVCGDVEVTRDLSGRLVPALYAMSGYFELVAEGGQLLLRPRLAQRSIRVRIEATQQAWDAFDELADDRSGLCQRALEKADVKRQLAAILADGFDVELPRRMLRDIALPAGFQESLRLADGDYTLRVTPAHVAVTPRWLWYGTDVAIERGARRADVASED
jgi:hypothetical protein